MTQDRRKDDKLPEGPLVFTDRNLTAAGLAHLEAERAAACLVHAGDDVWVGVGTKDALRGLLREDTASQSQAVPSELASLKQLAMAATPGPWEAKNGYGAGLEIYMSHPQYPDKDWPAFGTDSAWCKKGLVAYETWVQFPNEVRDAAQARNAAFIAAANPATILKLIEQVESLSHSAATGKVPTDAEIVDAVSDIFLSDYDSAAAYDIAVARAVLKLAASPAAPLAGKAEQEDEIRAQFGVAVDTQKAAMRYDWMRKFGYQAHELVFHDDGTLKWGKELDDAIDSALRLSAPLAAAVPAEEANSGDLDALVQEYGNAPVTGPGRTRRVVMQEIYKLAGEIFAPAEPAPTERIERDAIPASALTDGRILSIAEETAINYVTDERHPDNATIIDFAREIEKECARLSKPTAQGTAEPVAELYEILQQVAKELDECSFSQSLVGEDGKQVWRYIGNGQVVADRVRAAVKDYRHIAAQAPAGRDAILEEAAKAVETRIRVGGGRRDWVDAANVEAADCARVIRALKGAVPHAAEQASGGAK